MFGINPNNFCNVLSTTNGDIGEHLDLWSRNYASKIPARFVQIGLNLI